MLARVTIGYWPSITYEKEISLDESTNVNKSYTDGPPKIAGEKMEHLNKNIDDEQKQARELMLLTEFWRARVSHSLPSHRSTSKFYNEQSARPQRRTSNI